MTARARTYKLDQATVTEFIAALHEHLTMLADLPDHQQAVYAPLLIGRMSFLVETPGHVGGALEITTRELRHDTARLTC